MILIKLYFPLQVQLSMKLILIIRAKNISNLIGLDEVFKSHIFIILEHNMQLRLPLGLAQNIEIKGKTSAKGLER